MNKNFLKPILIFLLGLSIPVLCFAATTTQVSSAPSVNYIQNPLPIRLEMDQRFQQRKDKIITQISNVCDIFDSISREINDSNQIKPQNKQTIINILNARKNRLDQIKASLNADNPQQLKDNLLNLRTLIKQSRQDFTGIRSRASLAN